jgi:AcrR family transcriptional regulator
MLGPRGKSKTQKSGYNGKNAKRESRRRMPNQTMDKPMNASNQKHGKDDSEGSAPGAAPSKLPVPRKSSAERQEQILRELAGLLGAPGSARASTSELAKRVGVTEPALYRHFESKAKMLGALLDFCQAGLGSIQVHGSEALARVGAFMESNPSVARLMAGDGLSGEGRDLLERMEGLWVNVGKRAYPKDEALGQAGCDWLRGAMGRWIAGDRAQSAVQSEAFKRGLKAWSGS